MTSDSNGQDPTLDPPEETRTDTRTIGQKVRERARAQRAQVEAEEEVKRKERTLNDPADLQSAPPGREEGLRIVGRMVVFFFLVLVVYAFFRQLTYIVFAPDLQVLRMIVPEGEVAPGDPVKVGVLLRNRGPLDGAAFVVAVVGDREIEGATLDVPGRDTASIPVELMLNSGTHLMSLVV